MPVKYTDCCDFLCILVQHLGESVWKALVVLSVNVLGIHARLFTKISPSTTVKWCGFMLSTFEFCSPMAAGHIPTLGVFIFRSWSSTPLTFPVCISSLRDDNVGSSSVSAVSHWVLFCPSIGRHISRLPKCLLASILSNPHFASCLQRRCGHYPSSTNFISQPLSSSQEQLHNCRGFSFSSLFSAKCDSAVCR